MKQVQFFWLVSYFIRPLGKLAFAPKLKPTLQGPNLPKKIRAETSKRDVFTRVFFPWRKGETRLTFQNSKAEVLLASMVVQGYAGFSMTSVD